MNHDLDLPARDQDTSRSTPGARTPLVFGATGFIGRWLVKELLAQGVPTTAAVRSSASAGRLAAWLEDHGVAGRPARGPTPWISLRCEPRASTIALSSTVAFLILASTATSSASSSAAMRRHSRSSPP